MAAEGSSLLERAREAARSFVEGRRALYQTEQDLARRAADLERRARVLSEGTAAIVNELEGLGISPGGETFPNYLKRGFEEIRARLESLPYSGPAEKRYPEPPPFSPPTTSPAPGFEVDSSPAAVDEVAHGAAGSAKKEEMPEGFVMGGVDTGMVYGPTGIDETAVYEDLISRMHSALTGVEGAPPKKDGEPKEKYFARLSQFLISHAPEIEKTFSDEISLLEISREDLKSISKEHPEVSNFKSVKKLDKSRSVQLFVPSALERLYKNRFGFGDDSS